ncbi:unnamed protein product [Cuscuta campestris]|uniref:Integrase zinc-binding domain-containing protein n=1 Tax=Cuscuta campestris TaxID=132261 RepID=A0A484N0U3_9ASTE|nr:unnamed protein product [Cuscuta campestris]VFQ94736.1 unnamed protein product [Cuscuta campestris]
MLIAGSKCGSEVAHNIYTGTSLPEAQRQRLLPRQPRLKPFRMGARVAEQSANPLLHFELLRGRQLKKGHGAITRLANELKVNAVVDHLEQPVAPTGCPDELIGGLCLIAPGVEAPEVDYGLIKLFAGGRHVFFRPEEVFGDLKEKTFERTMVQTQSKANQPTENPPQGEISATRGCHLPISVTEAKALIQRIGITTDQFKEVVAALTQNQQVVVDDVTGAHVGGKVRPASSEGRKKKKTRRSQKKKATKPNGKEMLARAKYLASEEEDDEAPAHKEKKIVQPASEGRGPNLTGYQASRLPIHSVQSLRAPPRSRESYRVQDAPKFYEYHRNNTHKTSECVTLKKEMDQLIARGPPPRAERQAPGNTGGDLESSEKKWRNMVHFAEIQRPPLPKRKKREPMVFTDKDYLPVPSPRRDALVEQKGQLVSVLRSFKKLFVWGPEDMPCVDPRIVYHRLTMDPTHKPVKQKKCFLFSERMDFMTKEVSTLQSIRHIRERMKKYKDTALDLLNAFGAYLVEQVPREENTEADILSKLGPNSLEHIRARTQEEELSEPNISPGQVLVIIAKEPDWIDELTAYILEGSALVDSVAAKVVKRCAPSYALECRRLYKRSYNGTLLRCLRSEEAHKVMEAIHEGICSAHKGDFTMSRNVTLQGYFWTTIIRDCAKYVRIYKVCQDRSKGPG